MTRVSGDQAPAWLARAWRQRHPQWDACQIMVTQEPAGPRTWTLLANRGGVHTITCYGGSAGAAYRRAERAVQLCDKYMRYVADIVLDELGIEVELHFAEPGTTQITARVPLTVRVRLQARTMGGICERIDRELALRALAKDVS